MKPRFPHVPPVPSPGKFALHSGDHVPTRMSIAPQPTARLSPSHLQYSARPPHLLLALRTTRAPLAGCHAPALSAPTMRLALAPRVLAPPAPKAAGSTLHAPPGRSPFPHQRPKLPAHTRGWSPTSAGAAPPPLAPPGAASSCP